MLTKIDADGSKAYSFFESFYYKNALKATRNATTKITGKNEILWSKTQIKPSCINTMAIHSIFNYWSKAFKQNQ